MMVQMSDQLDLQASTTQTIPKECLGIIQLTPVYCYLQGGLFFTRAKLFVTFL